jgi:hypothetical protein
MGSRNNKPGRIVKGTALQPNLKDASGIWTLDEAMQAHRANAWPQPDLLQPVGNSLRTKNYGGSSAGSYGLRFGGRASTPTQATFSGWIKRGNNSVASDYWIFGSNQYITSTTIPPVLEVIIKGNIGGATDHSLTVAVENASLSYYTSTSALFRDMSAWYHIHVVYDSTQATDTNRIKIWVNGVQLTAMSGSSWPTRGYAIGTQTPSLGCLYLNGAPTRFFDGQMAEMNFIDGYAVDPSLFGKYDTNNTWVPIEYTGTHGTNGFYLPFTNTATSQTLGYDASVNGTATYDVDQDPYRGSVALHLTGNGPAGGQNNTFADSSPNNLAIVRSGSATQGSFSPFPMPANTPYNPAVHGASAYFGTSNTDNVYAASNSVLAIGTNNFTLEFWANWTAWTGNQRFILMGQSGASNLEISRDDGTNVLRIYISSSIITYTWTPETNAWHHIALVRTGTGSGQVTLYINGVNVATGTSATSISANNFFVGGLNWGAGYNMRGYISNVRLINGAAVYTSAFTPTNRPFGTLTNNLLPFSEDIANATWTAQSQGVSFTTNAAIAPDGTPSATLLVPSTSSASQNIAGLHDSAAGVNTFSIYAKSAGYRYIQCLHSRSAGGDSGYVTFDLTTGTVINSSVWSGSVVDVGNGWYRLIATTSSLAGASANSNVRWAFTDGSASRGVAFTGNGTSGAYVWGAQAELASSVGNYTPTPANFRTAPSLLLNFANAAVTDSAGAQNFTTVGGATITSSSKYGSGALTFNGTSDYLTMPNTSFTFAGNFTIELWGRTTSSSAVGGVFPTFFETSAYDSTGLGIKVVGGGSAACVWYNGSQILTGTSSIIDGAWHHIAVTRLGATMNLFVDGQRQSQFSSTATFTPGTVVVGGSSYNSFAGGWLSGQVDDLRVTNGLARYQSEFTPPARALPETGGKSFVTTNVTAGVVQRFTTTGTTSWTAPSDVTQVEVLVVAGGGAGGKVFGGGGGAGGVIYNNSYSVTPGQTYTVTVGAGGTATSGNGNNGANSVFGALTAIGGGGGASGGASGAGSAVAGITGGSAGGNSGFNGGGNVGGPSATAGTAGQGFAGGRGGSFPITDGGGGGGGAGAVGTNCQNTRGGDGGAGLQFGVSGTPIFYAGGGGGNNVGVGASSSGGSGSSGSNTAGSGTANTGGGGGGSYSGGTPGAGGSGIVLIRYTTTAVGNSSDATTDNLVDSPTLYGHDYGLGGEVVGNYATFNPLFSNGQTYTLSNGNLTVSNPSSWLAVLGTIAVSTGKWYFESYPADGVWHMTGVDQITRHTSHVGGTSGTKGVAFVFDPSDTRGDISYNGGNSVYTGASTSFNAGDVIGVALDLDNNNIKFYKNNVLQYDLSNILQSGASYTFGVSLFSGGTISGNFGQRAWAYAPPAGFNALTTKNLPRLTNAAAIAPNQYFDVTTIVGLAGDYQVTNQGFRPDLIWVKNRSNTQDHFLIDSVRGGTILSRGNQTNAENVAVGTPWISSFNTDGFSTSSNSLVTTGNSYVFWQWRAGGAAVSNTAGTITSQVSANTTSGFSIVTYSGNGETVATIGHGLGATPAMVITKVRNGTDDWRVWHQGLYQGADNDGHMIRLNSSLAAGYDSQRSTGGNSTTFRVIGNSSPYINATGSNYIAYVWAEVAGFSKFGTYTGNGSTDGPFVYTGFKPRWIMVKHAVGTSAASGSWQIFDTARDTFNPCDFRLQANGSGAEGSSAPSFDIVSNGFKLRSSNANWNEVSGTYIYMAFADKPFGNVNGTAR